MFDSCRGHPVWRPSSRSDAWTPSPRPASTQSSARVLHEGPGRATPARLGRAERWIVFDSELASSRCHLSGEDAPAVDRIGVSGRTDAGTRDDVADGPVTRCEGG